MRERIEVSPEMLAFVGGCASTDWPAGRVVMTFADVDGGATVAFGEVAGDAALVFAVERAACVRLFGFVPDPGTFHLPAELRAGVQAILDCPLGGPARTTLRLAKCIELFCGVMTGMAEETLLPADAEGALSEAEAARILAARRLIDERWREKLTLNTIARACGLNRTKLTRGFRLMFDCSVADLLAEHRLGGARRMLRETDLPVASIGYACGYHNNTSFTRAFSRRFGIAPTRLRQSGMAA